MWQNVPENFYLYCVINGSKLDAYILEDIERSYRRIEETNEKGGKQ